MYKIEYEMENETHFFTVPGMDSAGEFVDAIVSEGAESVAVFNAEGECVFFAN